jgi:hypothetical protein
MAALLPSGGENDRRAVRIAIERPMADRLFQVLVFNTDIVRNT